MLTSFIKSTPAFQALVDELKAGQSSVHAPSFYQGYLLAALSEELWPKKPLLVVVPDTAAASRLAADLRAFAAGRPVLLLPAESALASGGVSPAPRTAGLRHAAISSLAGGEPALLVAEAAALAERRLGLEGWPRPLTVSREAAPPFEAMVEDLAALGYERVEQVEEPGQFAVRGGIIDLFPSTDAEPCRLEYFGDELEALRRFSPFTQRSLSEAGEIVLFAAAEPEAPAAGLLEGGLPAPCFVLDPAMVQAALTAAWEDAIDVSPEAAAGCLQPEAVTGALAAAELKLESLAAGQPHSFTASSASFGARKPAEAVRQLQRLVKEDLQVFICFDTEGAARRAERQLEGRAENLAPGAALPAAPGAWLIAAPAPAGFISRDAGLAVFGERTLLRVSRARRREAVPGARAIISFRDLSPGDFVVHTDHGIGIFNTVVTKTVAGVTRDYLDLSFRDGDRLFVPQEQIASVSRYVGASAGAPALSKLGGKAWAAARARARNAAREMAGELLQLYAVRQGLAGHAFGPDDQWQMEFEAAFPFAETPDQAAAIDEVKDDMEAPRPMDRLICGDVGYGKTEVALRAAFKAASQGRQVMVLVPTTLLALQHYRTFSSRFAPYPVNVQMISRLRKPAENRKLAEAFNQGTIEVLIGTHRLLSSDIAPKDLGLVIIDEEQRFGVAQKEALRQLRLKVDVLSLSATPIPRTLQMSLTGIRDISVMETPPPGRNPIRTFVGEYDDQLVAQAIRRELARGGQVFFLHNRVETIGERAAQLGEQLGGVRFLVAHGQMPEGELEDVMAAFLKKEADVLVCTSIIESGLDIPSANTLIVDGADMLGLAQLYQIRGRIGRSNTVAHAWLLYPPDALPTPAAVARLSTLSDYTELGSGFKIAMRDLEIRGAGNLLGDEQSGHVAAVGFDLYCDLLRQAVAELKDEPARPAQMARVDIDLDAYIPAAYITLESARIDMHHRLAAAADEEELESLAAEMEDRFGPLPEPVSGLVTLQELRLRAAALGAAALSYRQGRLELSDITIDRAGRAALEASPIRLAYHPLRRTLAVWPGDGEAPVVVKESLDAIINSLLSVTNDS